jgi:hydrogenase maturation protein HypF
MFELNLVKRQKILITGRVQGVGFRPAVHKIATKLGLGGFVYNDTNGVTIELQGQGEKIAAFLTELQSGIDRPPLAQIKSCLAIDIAVVEGQGEFTIKASDSGGTPLSQVTADMAICGDCLVEMRSKSDFRYRYPFINCTNCGPRYSIVKTIPYDRANTTMSAFAMCGKCGEQYKDVTDRRFHAQPVACGTCGPKVWLTDSKGKIIEEQSDKAISKTADLLSEGKILGIKGVGGFHLAVDALNNQAVVRLRERKKRDNKPFAMMADSIETINKYAAVSKSAEQILRSQQCPIVLLPKKENSHVAASVAEGVGTFGFMLCYAPLHFLLFEQLKQTGIDILVMTSGNISDEPLICKNQKAIEKLGFVADAFLMHDREIYRQVDDSIVHIVGDEPVLIRRARGYVPAPILMEANCPVDIFAAGCDLKNTFCFVRGNQLICSEHVGDLEDAEVYHHYVSSIQHFRQLFEVEPKMVVCDLHPAYFSTQYAQSLKGVEFMQVQHHWAHIASVLAEHNMAGPVIGIECDGTGYGSDGAIWGCECMIASLEDFERFGHLAYYPLAGGDLAGKEALRPVMGLLKKTYGGDFTPAKFKWLLERIEPDAGKAEIIFEQIEKQINTVQTSSLGRIFDAVAAMTGIGTYNHFEAQLPIALESIIEAGVEDSYGFELVKDAGEQIQLDLRKMTEQMIADIRGKVAVGVISARFHNCLADGLAEMVFRAREKNGLNTVALSGGVFCNSYLINRLIWVLNKNGFRVLFNKEVPANDGGISVGQAAIAACRILKRRNM